MENQENKEIKKYLEERPIIPCLLISKENDRIEKNLGCLEKIPFSKIIHSKENYYRDYLRENADDYEIVKDRNFAGKIALNGNPLNFETKLNYSKMNKKKYTIFVGEYKLYSFTIKEQDLSFTSHYIRQFQKIAYSNSSDKEKAKESEKIFQHIGYYIPTKIYIGGSIINKFDSSKSSKVRDSVMDLKNELSFDVKKVKIDTDLKFNKKNKQLLKYILEDSSTEIIGGKKSDDIDKWIKSINLENSHVIECTNIIGAKDIVKDDIRKKLEIPLKMIEDNYSRKSIYLKTIEELKIIKLDTYEGRDDFIFGKCKKNKGDSEPLIYEKSFWIRREPKLVFLIIPVTSNRSLHETFDDIIVGFKIIDNRKDGYSGYWKIEENPILKKEINISFSSDFARKQDHSVYVYLMKCPK